MAPRFEVKKEVEKKSFADQEKDAVLSDKNVKFDISKFGVPVLAEKGKINVSKFGASSSGVKFTSYEQGLARQLSSALDIKVANISPQMARDYGFILNSKDLNQVKQRTLAFHEKYQLKEKYGISVNELYEKFQSYYKQYLEAQKLANQNINSSARQYEKFSEIEGERLTRMDAQSVGKAYSETLSSAKEKSREYESTPEPEEKEEKPQKKGKK